MTGQKRASLPPRLRVARAGGGESVDQGAVAKEGSWVARREVLVVPMQGMWVCEMGSPGEESREASWRG